MNNNVKSIGSILLLLTVSCIILAMCFMYSSYKRHSAEITDSLEENELERICDEFHISDSSRLEYAYSRQANQLDRSEYGIRIILKDASLSEMENIFQSDRIITEVRDDYNYLTSENKFVSSKIFVCSSETGSHEDNVNLYLFTENNTCYLEAAKLNNE